MPKDFDKLRRIVEDLQKDIPRAVRRPDPQEGLETWSDAVNALLREDEPPPVSSQQAEPAQQVESEQHAASRWPTPKTDLQKAIQEFADEKWPNGRVPNSNRVEQAMTESEVWKNIAVKRGVDTSPPDWHTIQVALGREVR